MRFMHTKSIFSLMFMSLMTFAATAQFDDLYYDPSDENTYVFEDNEFVNCLQKHIYVVHYPI